LARYYGKRNDPPINAPEPEGQVVKLAPAPPKLPEGFPPDWRSCVERTAALFPIPPRAKKSWRVWFWRVVGPYDLAWWPYHTATYALHGHALMALLGAFVSTVGPGVWAATEVAEQKRKRQPRRVDGERVREYEVWHAKWGEVYAAFADVWRAEEDADAEIRRMRATTANRSPTSGSAFYTSPRKLKVNGPYSYGGEQHCEVCDRRSGALYTVSDQRTAHRTCADCKDEILGRMKSDEANAR
jgi:hypothetical protein